MSLYAKMATIMASIDKVTKDAKMDAGKLNYKYVTDVQVYHMVRKLLIDNGLALFASMVEATQERYVTGKDKYDNDRDKYHTRAKFEFTLADSESGETMTCIWHGEADDSGDKGLNKAATAALKYWLLKTFIIPTGDDPDDVPSGQYSASAAQPPAAPKSPLDEHFGERPPREATNEWPSEARVLALVKWASNDLWDIPQKHAVNRIAIALGVTPATASNLTELVKVVVSSYQGSAEDALKAIKAYVPRSEQDELKLAG